MAIRVEYAPVEAAMSLSRAAGVAAGRQIVAVEDRAFLQHVSQMQQQADVAMAQKQAFSLQKAMLARRTATPIAKAEIQSIAPDQVLQRSQVRQRQQLTQLSVLAESGDYSQAQVERAKLAVYSGISPLEALKEQSMVSPITSSSAICRRK